MRYVVYYLCMATIESLPGKEHADYEKTVLDSLHDAGFEGEPEPELVERLDELEEYSKFNEDSRRVRIAVERIMDHLGIKDKGDVTVATIVHDIGKSGPKSATKEQQMTVIKLYAAEGLKDPKQSVEDAIKGIFPEETEEMLANLRNCGVDPSENMRAFWDHHATWTYDTLEKWPAGFSKNMRVIAATHHIDRGINPYHLAESDVPLQAKMVGTMEYYVEALQMRILMVADKMEAAMRRAGDNHEQAMALTKRLLGPMAEHDEAMALVLAAVGELGKQGKLFDESAFRAAA